MTLIVSRASLRLELRLNFLINPQKLSILYCLFLNRSDALIVGRPRSKSEFYYFLSSSNPRSAVLSLILFTVVVDGDDGNYSSYQESEPSDASDGDDPLLRGNSNLVRGGGMLCLWGDGYW